MIYPIRFVRPPQEDLFARKPHFSGRKGFQPLGSIFTLESPTRRLPPLNIQVVAADETTATLSFLGRLFTLALDAVLKLGPTADPLKVKYDGLHHGHALLDLDLPETYRVTDLLSRPMKKYFRQGDKILLTDKDSSLSAQLEIVEIDEREENIKLSVLSSPSGSKLLPGSKVKLTATEPRLPLEKLGFLSSGTILMDSAANGKGGLSFSLPYRIVLSVDQAERVTVKKLSIALGEGILLGNRTSGNSAVIKLVSLDQASGGAQFTWTSFPKQSSQQTGHLTLNTQTPVLQLSELGFSDSGKIQFEAITDDQNAVLRIRLPYDTSVRKLSDSHFKLEAYPGQELRLVNSVTKSSARLLVTSVDEGAQSIDIKVLEVSGDATVAVGEHLRLTLTGENEQPNRILLRNLGLTFPDETNYFMSLSEIESDCAILDVFSTQAIRISDNAMSEFPRSYQQGHVLQFFNEETLATAKLKIVRIDPERQVVHFRVLSCPDSAAYKEGNIIELDHQDLDGNEAFYLADLGVVASGSEALVSIDKFKESGEKPTVILVHALDKSITLKVNKT